MVDTTWGAGAPLDDPGEIVSTAEALATQARELLGLRATAATAARAAVAAATAGTVTARLAELPLDALKDATDGRLRLGALEDAGITTVAQVRAKGRLGLELIPGVGPKTSAQVLAAADQIEAALRTATRVRFDVEARPPEQTTLLAALRHLELVERFVEPLAPRLEAIAAAVAADVGPARLETQRIRRFFASGRRKSESTAALARLNELLLSPDTSLLVTELSTARSQLGAAAPAGAPVDVWADFLARPVAYNGLLAEIAGLAPDEAASHGLLPEEIVERVAAFDLDTSLLDVSLRGYQAFGAKFCLVQERTILGDDMGLGKTVEAIAVIAHLRARGASRFLVVCPASVLANWGKEIVRHTHMDDEVLRIHGPSRDAAVAQWATAGGIAVTTFGTLRALELPNVGIDAVVVDEAHFAKNPDAQRTQAVRDVVRRSRHVVLMSGTPMENRVEEFRTLVDHIRPDLAAGIHASSGVAGADSFRRAVAPVYLRRNQVDVLDELPPRIDAADWVDLDGPSLVAYRDAVAAENFMAMRRAAFVTPEPLDSPKLARLVEIVQEAVENERKVVVFSFFLDVIERVHAAVGELAVGPLTGSVPAPERQVLVDEFTARAGSAVLVSQIEAGGVGLNIQAASVVVLTEPQWKPTTEEQAIARCHRMGQVRPVEVHRLLAEDSVDERMVEILAHKSALFADYVRKSDMKDATPAAVDVTDQASVAEVVDGLGDDSDAAEAAEAAGQAEHERQIIEVERTRLGLPPAGAPAEPAPAAP